MVRERRSSSEVFNGIISAVGILFRHVLILDSQERPNPLRSSFLQLDDIQDIPDIKRSWYNCRSLRHRVAGSCLRHRGHTPAAGLPQVRSSFLDK